MNFFYFTHALKTTMFHLTNILHLKVFSLFYIYLKIILGLKSTKNTSQMNNDNNNSAQSNSKFNILEDNEKPKDSAIITNVVNKKSQYTGGLVLEPKKGFVFFFLN